MSAPRDRFTPHGYLDNPYHTRNSNPSGVIRSTPGIGFGWHFPALAQGYGFREIYRASLGLGVMVGDRVHYLPEHFPDLYADIHTKNRVRFRWRGAGVELCATFYRIGEHALACRLTLTSDRSARLIALLGYSRQLGAAGGWGESGLVARIDAGQLVLQGFEDGEAFALASDRGWEGAGASTELSEVFLRAPALDNGDHSVVTGRRGDSVTLHGAASFVCDGSGDHSLQLILARGLRRDLAVAESWAGLAARHTALYALKSEDSAFWRHAPRLAGDWPDSWRRGVVYDLETLRMMVRTPSGIYRHPWDAMQIQAPRVVLAEAAIDALLLSYADPAAAKALLLGTFLDAPAANIPCSREDGSYNMVGANGSECGTAPEWGYPFRVAEHLWRLGPEDGWLAAIYPPLARFLDWWLENRCDDEGYLVYDNSWESGQDLSARFGPQKQGGGSTIRTVRPVDLQAAAAHACRVLTMFAGLLDNGEEARWSELQRAFESRVEGLWHDGAYRDYDAHVGWSDVWDVMQLAPLALGLASTAKVEALRQQIDALGDVPYLWPMFVWTATDAAQVAGRHQVAAAIAHATLERAYGMWDAREPSVAGTLPGISCEYWGTDGRFGAEGYGWGAFGLHLLFATLLGVRPHPDGVEVRPNLPPELRLPGRSYTVRNLVAHDHHFDLTLVAGAGGEARLSLRADRPIFSTGGTEPSSDIELVLAYGDAHLVSLESDRKRR